MVRTHDGRLSPRVSDEELEYYGDLYIQWAIREAGVDFEGFLTNPEYYLDRHARGRWRTRKEERKGLRSYLRLRQATRRHLD